MMEHRIYFYLNLGKKNECIVGYVQGFKLQIIRKPLFYEIILGNLFLEYDLQLRSGDVLYFDQVDIYPFICMAESMEISKGTYYQTIILKGKLDSSVYRNSTNFYFKLLDSWSRNEQKYHWSSLPVFQKRLWINACRMWHNVYVGEIRRNSLILQFDCRKIKDKYDFYCYLGEVFFGYGGYMGSNLDAMNDCLSEIPNRKNFTLQFVNYSSMPEFAGLSENILDIFKTQGMTVKILLVPASQIV